MSNTATLWKLEQDKQELVAVTEKRMEGVLLRSRARWIAEGEKLRNTVDSRNVIIYLNKWPNLHWVMERRYMKARTLLRKEKYCTRKWKYFTTDYVLKAKYKNVKYLDMAHDIPMLTLQDKTSLEGEITLVKVIFALIIWRHYKTLAPLELLLF